MYTDTRINSWSSYTDVWAHGFFYWDYCDTLINITSVDKVAQLIKTYPAPQYGFRGGQRYYYMNILEELDQAGEYYIDRTNAVLYFWPPSPITSDTDVTLSIQTSALISISNANNTVVQGKATQRFGCSFLFSKLGFTFETTRGDALTAGNTYALFVSDCTFRDIGGVAVTVTNGWNALVQRSHVYRIGTAGILAKGGIRNSLTPSNHMIFNNVIEDFGKRIYCYQAGVKVGLATQGTLCVVCWLLLTRPQQLG